MAYLTTMILAGCSNALTDNPQSVLGQSNFYTTQTRINEGVIGCYAGLATVMDNEWMFTELRSDNTCQFNINTSNTNLVDQTDLNVFRAYPSMVGIASFWYSIYQNISNINAVLPSVKDNTYITNEPLREQYEAELLFIRAFHYYQLVNLFGNVFKVTTVIGPNDALKMTQSPVADIYNQIIIPDLKKAAIEAPSSYTGTDVGRVTKWAAEGLLAKAYMMLGGPQNLDSAKVLLQNVLAAPTLGLMPTYASIFSTSNEMNKEIIFAVRYQGGSSGIGSPFWSMFAPSGSGNLYLKVGTPLGYNTPTPEIVNLFQSNPTDTRANVCFQIWNKSVSYSLPFIYKYNDPSISVANQGENDWIVLRYADIELLYAEVLAQDGNYATANQWVNNIRVRAGVTPLPAFTSENQALDAVYNERRLEFAFEDQRWYDLLRMAKSYNDPQKPIEILKRHVFQTDWSVLYSLYTPIEPPDSTYFTTDRLILPIPQREIDTNTAIKIAQNPGY